MEKLSRKDEFLDVTMRIVAESGLDNFSMQKVTKYIGVSDALIYKYYPTKEILLYSCFESVHKRIAALYNGIRMPALQTAKELYDFIRNLWMTYFSFLVNSGYKTIYYFDYRDSPHIRQVTEHDDEVAKTYFKSFAGLIHAFAQAFPLRQDVNSPILWTFILDTSGVFAKRVIRGELPSDPESYENIWQLLSGGILGLIQA